MCTDKNYKLFKEYEGESMSDPLAIENEEEIESMYTWFRCNDYKVITLKCGMKISIGDKEHIKIDTNGMDILTNMEDINDTIMRIQSELEKLDR